MHSEEGVCHDIAPALARPPRLNVVVAPYQGVDDGYEVEDEEHEADDGTGKLPIPPEKASGNPCDEEGDETEEDPEEEVDLERWRRVGGTGANTFVRGCCEAELGKSVGR